MQKLRPDMGIGKNLRKIRTVRGYTQAEVATFLQLRGCIVSAMTYSKMERNIYNIRISELFALKEIFELDSFDPFFEEIEPLNEETD